MQKARVTKLEAAMAAVGESDPTFAGLQDALKKAKAQAQVRPVADRIASSKVFIERAEEDHHWSRRSFPGSGGFHVSAGKVAIRRAWVGRRGTFKDVRFCPILNFGHFLASPRL